MSWQEELRKLDEELAAGQISADDYRVRRDQVLSSAVSSGAEGQEPGKAEATQFMPPATASNQPLPPVQPMEPYQPPSQPGVGDRTQVVGGDADKTQIVPGQGDADRTQAVGGWQAARPGGPDADRTQVVPGVPPQSYVGGQPPRPAPGQGPFTPPPGFPPPQGWQQQEEDLAPPWAGSVFPPLAPSGSPDWVRQGPEVFEEQSSGAGKKTLLIALIVLVLAGLGVGLYFLVLKKDDSGGSPPVAESTTPAPPKTTKPTTTTKPRNPDPIQALLEDMPAPPAASQQQDAKVLDLAQLAQLQLMDAPEVQLLEQAGVTKVPYKSGVRKAPDDGPTPDAMSAMVIPMKSEADATKLVEDLRKYQESVGFLHIAEPLPNMPPQVVFEKAFPPDGKSIYRGLYASGKNVVRITTIQAPSTNEASLSGTYRNHTEAMMRVFPVK